MRKFIKRHKKWLIAATAVTISLAMVLSTVASLLAASAGFYDLTTDNTTVTYTINGAIWERFQPLDPSGTGNFNTFHQVHSNGTERGYNTDAKPKQFDEGSSANFNRSYLLIDVPQFDIGGVIYREFQLDINEQGSDPNWFMSLDQFQVWVTDAPNSLTYTEGSPSGAFGSNAVLVYDLDGDGNTYIEMDFRANAGSGKRDYRVLVPQSMFDGKTGEYVVLFTRHGDALPTDDGFEEWGVRVIDAHKSGYKFNDLNADLVWDQPGELGLNGWTINLVGEDADGGAVSMSTVTANHPVSGDPGYYEFSVPGGTYNISEVLQGGWYQSLPGGDGTYDEILGNGALSADNNFGNYTGTPDLEITKTGDDLSKIGDEVTYNFVIQNIGDVELELVSVIDDVLGDITGYVPVAGEVLNPTEITTFIVNYEIQGDDPDPLINTVEAIYNWTAQAQDVSDTDVWATNLFQPSLAIDKTGDDLSKIGDDVDYTITVTNTSSADSPNMSVTITDPMLGINQVENMAPGDVVVINTTYTVLAGDPDPLLNTAEAIGVVDVFGNVIGPVSDGHSVNLFQPAVEVIKDGPAEAYVGDVITYTFTINNLSSSDTPPLALVSVTDTVLGDLTAAAAAAGGDVLVDGESVTFTATWTITGDPNPLVNVVTVLYNPTGFPNPITDDDPHSVVVLVRYDTTAWAAQEDPGQTRFVDRGDWATYVTYDIGSATDVASAIEYPLFAGQTYRSGTLFVYDDAGILYVKYSTEGQDPAYKGYTGGEWKYITAYHLQVVDEQVGFDPYLTAKGKAIPGQFDLNDYLGDLTETGWIEVNVNISGYQSGDAYIAAHAIMSWIGLAE